MSRPLAFSGNRRNVLVWVAVGALVVVLVAAGIVLATRSTTPPPPSPAASTRVVALGDSVPYGHGLSNPYPTPQIGLPPRAISQGPALQAYPSLVTRDLRLTMTVRPTNCHLVGDQLAISGAVADPADNTARDGQCPVPPQQARNLPDEIAAAALAQRPARLVFLQDGADDIHFSSCLEYELARVAGISVGLGSSCLADGKATPQLTTELSRVRSSLAHAIEEIAPHAGTIEVLTYYQPVPEPGQIAAGTAQSGLDTNLVCAGLEPNAASTFAAAQVVLTDLNSAITGAVADARTHHVTNVRLLDMAGVMAGHGMCTAAPWVFSGEPLPATTLADDAGKILAAKACNGTADLHAPVSCSSLDASKAAAESDLQDYVWRAAHPNLEGQQSIANAVAADLGRGVGRRR